MLPRRKLVLRPVRKTAGKTVSKSERARQALLKNNGRLTYPEIATRTGLNINSLMTLAWELRKKNHVVKIKRKPRIMRKPRREIKKIESTQAIERVFFEFPTISLKVAQRLLASRRFTVPLGTVKTRKKRMLERRKNPLVVRPQTRLRPWTDSNIIVKNGRIEIAKPALRTPEAIIRKALYESQGTKSKTEIERETGILYNTINGIVQKISHENNEMRVQAIELERQARNITSLEPEQQLEKQKLLKRAEHLKKTAEKFQVRFKKSAKGRQPELKASLTTPLQEKAFEEAKVIVRRAIKVNASRYKFFGDDLSDVETEVGRLLPGWIISLTEKNPKYTRKDLQKKIRRRVRGTVASMNISRLAKYMKISFGEANALTAIFVRLDGVGRRKRITLEQAVREVSRLPTYRKLNLTLKSVQTLLADYKREKKSAGFERSEK